MSHRSMSGMAPWAHRSKVGDITAQHTTSYVVMSSRGGSKTGSKKQHGGTGIHSHSSYIVCPLSASYRQWYLIIFLRVWTTSSLHVLSGWPRDKHWRVHIHPRVHTLLYSSRQTLFGIKEIQLMSRAFSNAHLWNIPFVMGDVITSLWSKETPRRMYESKRAKKTHKHSAEVEEVSYPREWLRYYLLSATPFYKLYC